jgi:hypothetical protein
VSPEADTNEHFANQQPRCEHGKTLFAEEECRKPGEVLLDGSLLCLPHAELLRLEEGSEIMLGMVLQMDQWLDSIDGQADELRVQRAEHHLNELLEQLRFNRARILLIRDESLKDKDGTP